MLAIGIVYRLSAIGYWLVQSGHPDAIYRDHPFDVQMFKVQGSRFKVGFSATTPASSTPPFKPKSRRDDMIIAQGKRVRERRPGSSVPALRLPSPPFLEERGGGRGGALAMRANELENVSLVSGVCVGVPGCMSGKRRD